MATKRSFHLSGQIVVGIAAIFFGLLFLLDNMDVVDARIYIHYWPVFLIVFGLARILQSSHGGGRFFGAIVTLVGILLLLRALGFTEVGFRELWPLILVLIGGSLILGNSAGSPIRRDSSASTDSNAIVNAFAILGGFQRSNNSQDFRGGEVSAIMGGCEIDLRQAAIQEEEAIISTFAFWGGIKIRVPQSWSVSVRGFPFLGGFDDKSVQPSNAAAKRLVINGTAIMGGVEVTN